jgi:hypothetical protein
LNSIASPFRSPKSLRPPLPGRQETNHARSSSLCLPSSPPHSRTARFGHRHGSCYGVNCRATTTTRPPDAAIRPARGLLEATGSTSISADDIVYTATHLSPNSVSLLVISSNQRNIPFHNGRLCIGPGMRRMHNHVNSGQEGTSVFDDVVATFASTGFYLQAGETWHGQVWYRDSGHQGMCGVRARDQPDQRYTVTFTP